MLSSIANGATFTGIAARWPSPEIAVAAPLLLTLSCGIRQSVPYGIL